MTSGLPNVSENAANACILTGTTRPLRSSPRSNSETVRAHKLPSSLPSSLPRRHIQLSASHPLRVGCPTAEPASLGPQRSTPEHQPAQRVHSGTPCTSSDADRCG